MDEADSRLRRLLLIHWTLAGHRASHLTIDLAMLATSVRDLNAAAERVSAILGRPALPGHFGEALAAAVFDVALTQSATTRGHDGHFRTGQLAGKSVNIKFYPRHERLLDINPQALPDYFLVLAGPTSAATSSRGRSRPWVVDQVFLLNGADIVALVRSRGTKVGIATSVPKAAWLAAEIYPRQRSPLLELSAAQIGQLAQFGSPAG